MYIGIILHKRIAYNISFGVHSHEDPRNRPYASSIFVVVGVPGLVSYIDLVQLEFAVLDSMKENLYLEIRVEFLVVLVFACLVNHRLLEAQIAVLDECGVKPQVAHLIV